MGRKQVAFFAFFLEIPSFFNPLPLKFLKKNAKKFSEQVLWGSADSQVRGSKAILWGGGANQ